MNANRVCASEVLSTKDLKMRTEQDLTEIVARFLAVGEGVVAHWVEYAQRPAAVRHGAGRRPVR